MFTIDVSNYLPISDARGRWAQERVYKQWCMDNCPNSWNYYGEYKKWPYIFRFRDEQDLLAFKLKFIL